MQSGTQLSFSPGRETSVVGVGMDPGEGWRGGAGSGKGVICCRHTLHPGLRVHPKPLQSPW